MRPVSKSSSMPRRSSVLALPLLASLLLAALPAHASNGQQQAAGALVKAEWRSAELQACGHDLEHPATLAQFSVSPGSEALLGRCFDICHGPRNGLCSLGQVVSLGNTRSSQVTFTTAKVCQTDDRSSLAVLFREVACSSIGALSSTRRKGRALQQNPDLPQQRAPSTTPAPSSSQPSNSAPWPATQQAAPWQAPSSPQAPAQNSNTAPSSAQSPSPSSPAQNPSPAGKPVFPILRAYLDRVAQRWQGGSGRRAV